MILFVDLLAEDGVGLFVDNGYQVFSLPFPIADDAGAGWNGTYLPTFANRLIRGRQSLIRSQLVSAPNHSMEIGFEEKGINGRLHNRCLIWPF